MKANFYKITFILLLFALSSNVFSQSILMVTKVDIATQSVHASDSALKAYLEDFAGWTVTAIDAGDFSVYTTAGIYGPYDAIYISEVLGSDLTKPYEAAGYPIPCVTNEGYAVQDGKWNWIPAIKTDEYFIQMSGTQRTKGTLKLIIHDVDNFISNRYTTDYELDWTNWPDSLADKIGVTGFKLDECVDGAIALGHFASDSIAEFPSLWAIPEGSVVIHSSATIASNVVIVGTVDKAVGIYSTDEYLELLYWSFKWAMGDETVPDEVSKNNFQYNDLNVWPNPTIGDVNFSLTLSKSGNAKINIYNVAGKLIESFNSDNLSAGKNTIKLDFSGKAEGLYFYDIITEKDLYSGKIIK